jgi:hypothetical protein
MARVSSNGGSFRSAETVEMLTSATDDGDISGDGGGAHGWWTLPDGWHLAPGSAATARFSFVVWDMAVRQG